MWWKCGFTKHHQTTMWVKEMEISIKSFITTATNRHFPNGWTFQRNHYHEQNEIKKAKSRKKTKGRLSLNLKACITKWVDRSVKFSLQLLDYRIKVRTKKRALQAFHPFSFSFSSLLLQLEATQRTEKKECSFETS